MRLSFNALFRLFQNEALERRLPPFITGEQLRLQFARRARVVDPWRLPPYLRFNGRDHYPAVVLPRIPLSANVHCGLSDEASGQYPGNPGSGSSIALMAEWDAYYELQEQWADCENEYAIAQMTAMDDQL